ncbi:hypothetical protein [Erwinia pyrifoliae]|uniref:hypothetical protein n=1 Tax=Erwinia pyrifoliae TaxID=79967 RepID=UPI00220D636B|nr:hypothetical protein [Erwinia pyrifoliae]MCT2388593.1 hypothetical protein [Erwinia pyrifoliae]UWS30642.1 hypothetical protein NYP81_04015 [Erwinia pyrifoliae]
MKYKNLCLLGLFSLLSASFSVSAEELLKRQNVEPGLNCTNGPSKIKSQSDFYSIFGDYTEEDGTLKVISRNPLKIHVYAEVVKGDHPDVIDHVVKKALISNAYRAFAFSDISKISVTSSAKEINFGNGTKKEIKSPTYTLTKTREQALTDLRKLTNTKTFNDLFEKHQVCLFSRSFKQFLYDDQGGIGISKFYDRVKK